MLILHRHIKYKNFTLIFTIFLLFNNVHLSQVNSFEEGVIYLSKIIAENKFNDKSMGDLAVIDSLYSTAITIYEGDISEALLALTFATLPFNRMPVKFPFTNIRLNLRLPSVDEETFLLRRTNLPGKLYFDSNNNKFGDKDKISHFFGNAFLAYNVSFINLSKFLGQFVEMFEASFKVSSGIDFRDLQSNHLGEFFGSSLLENPSIKPSDFFKLYSLFYFSYN